MGFRPMVRIHSINEHLKSLLHNDSLGLLSECKEFKTTVAAQSLEIHEEFLEKVKTIKIFSPNFYS